MKSLLNLVRRRPLLVIVSTVLVVAVVGTILGDGYEFLARPLPFFSKGAAGTWAIFNVLISLVTMGVVYRNIYRYETKWTWQELAFSRGAFLLVFAGWLGYLARIQTPVVSLGTPLFSLGVLAMLYASLRPPVRFEEEDDD